MAFLEDYDEKAVTQILKTYDLSALGERASKFHETIVELEEERLKEAELKEVRDAGFSLYLVFAS
jgi:hypothetical protein|eukprot:2142285-Prymnesium_polylepis.1